MKKEIENYVKQLADEDGIKLYKVLENKTEISEFTIAEKLKKDINQTRTILYKLYSKNLVNFVRKKDEKKEWYICYWTFNHKEALRQMLKIKNAPKIIKSKESIFTCDNLCLKMEFEEAFENNFKCLECGNLMDYEETISKIKKLQ